MPSILASIQNDIAARLQADPFFAAIPVVIETPRDLNYELARSNAETGTYVLVLIPQAQVASASAPGPIFDPVEITLIVRENVPVATGSHALEVAETALALLHLYRPPTVNEVISAAPNALVRLNEPDVVAYQIRVRTQAAATYPVPQLDPPVITSAGTATPQTVTLTSDLPGAAIFYTTDGSQPAPRNPTAQLYLAPFTLSFAASIRARAWLAGYTTSVETRATYT